MAGSKKRLRLKWLAVQSDSMTLHAYRITKDGSPYERSECGLTEATKRGAEKAEKCRHCLFTNSRNRR